MVASILDVEVLVLTILVMTVCANGLLSEMIFDVHFNTSVSNVGRQVASRSLLECAASCSELRLESNGCLTATYNSVTKQCILSKDNITMASAVTDSAIRTVALKHDCGPPPFVANGIFSAPDFNVGTTATLVCLPGYIADGAFPANITCNSSLSWSETAATCVVDNTTVSLGDYYGTWFITGFLNGPGDPTLTIVSSEVCLININIPYLNITDEFYVNGTTSRVYSTAIVSVENGNVSNKGIEVLSSCPVMVFTSCIFQLGSVDSTFVFPVPSLGTDYVGLAYNYTISLGSESLLLVGTEDQTTVTLSMAGVVETYSLGKLETMMRTMEGLSGSIIQATKKIYVCGGHVGVNIPNSSFPYADYIVETLPPISSFGTVFIIGHMYPRDNFTIGIAAAVDGTEVKIYNDTATLVEIITLARGSSVFRTYNWFLAVSVISNEGILVMQYGHGSVNWMFGDPSQMLIPSILNFGKSYELDPLVGYDSVIAVAVPNGQESGIKINGTTFTPDLTVSVNIPGIGIHKMLYGSIAEGYAGVVNHTDPQVSFGAWLYGRSGSAEYATSLGMLV